MIRKHFYLFLLGALFSSSLCASETKPEEQLLHFKKKVEENPELAIIEVHFRNDAYAILRPGEVVIDFISPFKIISPDNLSLKKKLGFNRTLYGMDANTWEWIREPIYGGPLLSLPRAFLFIIEKIEKELNVKNYSHILLLLQTILYDQDLYKTLPKKFLTEVIALYQALLEVYNIEYNRYKVEENIRTQTFERLVEEYPSSGRTESSSSPILRRILSTRFPTPVEEIKNKIIKEQIIFALLAQGKMNTWPFCKDLQKCIAFYMPIPAENRIPLFYLNAYLSLLEHNMALTPKHIDNKIASQTIQESLKLQCLRVCFKEIKAKKFQPSFSPDGSHPIPFFLCKALTPEALKEQRDELIVPHLAYPLLAQGKMNLLLPPTLQEFVPPYEIQRIISSYLPSHTAKLPQLYINTYSELLANGNIPNHKNIVQRLRQLDLKDLQKPFNQRLALAWKKFYTSLIPILTILKKAKIPRGKDDDKYPITIEDPLTITTTTTPTTFHIAQQASPLQNTSVNPTATLKD